jgi:hydroxymethylglutaryl-CoA reductase
MFQPNSTNPFEGFSKLTPQERKDKILQLGLLSKTDLNVLEDPSLGLTQEQAQHLIENVIGLYSLPLGVATGFLIDGRDVLVPMVVEETSIVAAASASAKWIRRNGGIKTRALGHLIIGQVQFPRVSDFENLSKTISSHKDRLLAEANAIVPNLVARGGGVESIELRALARPDGHTMAVLHVYADACDAMGANLITMVCEGLKPTLESLTGEKVGLCILSNLVDSKLVEATCEIKDIDPMLGKAIEDATLFAELDPYRRATHIKGIMNGIDPILIATGNDWRAVEAGVHAYANLSKSPKAITSWTYKNGSLHGCLVAPLAVGTVGGVTKIHPVAKVALKLMQIENAQDLARVCAAVGLAQNLGALRALCSEGIIRGHMQLHASNFAIMAGATKDELPHLEKVLRSEPKVTLSRAQELLQEMRANA